MKSALYELCHHFSESRNQYRCSCSPSNHFMKSALYVLCQNSSETRFEYSSRHTRNNSHCSHHSNLRHLRCSVTNGSDAMRTILLHNVKPHSCPHLILRNCKDSQLIRLDCALSHAYHCLHLRKVELLRCWMISSTIPSSATSVALCCSSPSKQGWRLPEPKTYQPHKHLCIGPGPYPHPYPHAFRKYVHTTHFRSRPSPLQAKVMIRQVLCQGTQHVGPDTGSPPGGQPSPDANLLVPSIRFYFLLVQYSSFPVVLPATA